VRSLLTARRVAQVRIAWEKNSHLCDLGHVQNDFHGEGEGVLKWLRVTRVKIGQE
jgi:hypothetical protein